MEREVLEIKPAFYTESPYAKYIASEKDDQSYGLIFYEFLHALGLLLEVDIIFDHPDTSHWIVANNEDMEIVFQRKDNVEFFTFQIKTKEGMELFQQMTEHPLLKENDSFIYFH